MDEMQLPKGTIVISVPSVEKGHELVEMFQSGGATSAVLGMTQEGEIVIAVEPGEFSRLQGMTSGDMTIEITEDGIATPTKRGKA